MLQPFGFAQNVHQGRSDDMIGSNYLSVSARLSSWHCEWYLLVAGQDQGRKLTEKQKEVLERIWEK